MVCWLMAVHHVGRHAGSWSYVPGSTRNHDNEWKTNSLGWMLYSMYAVLSVNSRSWHREIQRDDLTLSSAMMVELWMTIREMGEEDENDMEDTSGYEKSGLLLAWLGSEDVILVLLCVGSGLVPAVSRMVYWLAHETVRSHSFSSWFPPSHLISLFRVLNTTIT